MVEAASIDSRLVRGGELFVPIVAERDGHDFVSHAAAHGAVAYLSARGDCGVALPRVDVSDTSKALAALGRAARERVADRVVGVTGSVGKTSTKDLLAAVLAQRWSTTANRQSFNNELGVPLTLMSAEDSTEATVIEMGARGPGHIALLCGIARPTVGVVTVVRGAHLEMFGDLDGVAAAKGELIDALPATGTGVLNADDERVAAMAGRCAGDVVLFGWELARGDVRAERIVLDGELRPSFELRSPWGSASVRLAVRGRHQVTNALAAATAGMVCGVSLDRVVEALASAELSPSRMEMRLAADGLRVLDDAYNANPASMLAALEALAELSARRRVAVVGTMAELGPDADAQHAYIARHARRLGLDVLAVGEPRYTPKVAHVADLAEAEAYLRGLDLGDGDVVLCKASHSVGLDRLALWLVGQARADAES